MTLPRRRMGRAWTGAEAGAERLDRERGPAPLVDGQVVVRDRQRRAIAVEAGPFLRLDLEQLQHPKGVARRRHDPQLAVGPRQHDAGRSDAEHVDAAVGDQREQLDHVEIGYERVGQLDERPGERRFSRHRISRHRGPGTSALPLLGRVTSPS